eukprot:g1161.t1
MGGRRGDKGGKQTPWGAVAKGKGLGVGGPRAVPMSETFHIAALRPYPGADGEWLVKRGGARNDAEVLDTQQMAGRLTAANCEAVARPAKWISMAAGTIRQCHKVMKFVEHDPRLTGLPQLAQLFDDALATAAQALDTTQSRCETAECQQALTTLLGHFSDADSLEAWKRAALYAANVYNYSMQCLQAGHMRAAPPVQPPLKMARAKASAPGPTSAQVERQRQEDGLAQVLAFLGEPSSDQAATAAAFLDQLHQVKSKAGIPEELRRGGLFVLAYTGEKFPADQKTAELEELMNELKAAEVPQEAQQKLELKEKLFLSKLLPAENLAVFVENLVGACTAVPGPKHDQLRAALEQVPSSLRLLLGLPAPGKYSRQKAHGWERDFSRMLALAAAGFRAHYDALLCPDSPAEVQEAEEEEEEPEDTLDADVAAALALGP